MTNNNDFAERLQNWIADPYHRLTDDNPDPSWLLDEALTAERLAGWNEGNTASTRNHQRELIDAQTAERRATVERIRTALLQRNNPDDWAETHAILDAEAN
jgi:hypothetical protein